MTYKQIKILTARTPSFLEEDVNMFLKQCQQAAYKVLGVYFVGQNTECNEHCTELSVMVIYMLVE